LAPFYSEHIIGKKFSIHGVGTWNKLIYIKNKNIILRSDFVHTQSDWASGTFRSTRNIGFI